MEKREFKATLVDKEKKKRWFFGPNFLVTFRIPEFKEKIHIRNCTPEQYYDPTWKVGGECVIYMYSENGRYWSFSEVEAQGRVEREE